MPGVIVTGGGSGIGLALVSALLRRPANYRIFATGQRALEGTDLAKVLDECTDQDRTRVLYSAGDTGDVDTVQRQYAEATEFFGGDVPKGLFLNAGIGGGRYPLEDFDVDRFDAMLRTNVRGVFLWLRAALPALKGCDEPSQICVTSSVMGSRPVAEAAPYCATKYAVNGLVLSLRAELKASGHSHVKCGLVCPAGVATPWWNEQSRGFKAADAPAPDTSKFLAAEAVATACVAMLEQHPSANAETVMLDATG